MIMMRLILISEVINSVTLIANGWSKYVCHRAHNDTIDDLTAHCSTFQSFESNATRGTEFDNNNNIK